MRTSRTLTKLRAGKTARVCSLGHFNPAYIRHAAHFGFDAIWLDLEHRTMTDREVQALLAYFHLSDIDCMLRAPTLEPTRLYRYLEDGAAGLMIPHVSTPEKAASIVQATRFPPLGNRGLDGAGLDCDFMLAADPDYTEDANRETFIVVQIETMQAVENVDEIASIPGIDVLFVGPADLGLRRKHEPDTAPEIEAMIERVAAAAAENGKAWGIPAANLEQLEKRHAQGARFLASGGDFVALMGMLESVAGDFDSLEA